MTTELKEFLNIELKLEQNLPANEIIEFYSVIADYLNNRSKIETLESNLLSLRKIFFDFGLTEKEIIVAIKTNPSYIHADKVELVIKFYLLGKIVDSKTNICARNHIIVNNGKYLRTNFNVIYARIKHLISLREQNEVLRNEFITPRKIFKITNEEFKNTYGLAREELLSMYPFTMESLEEIKNWEENLYLYNWEEEPDDNNRIRRPSKI